MLKALKHVGTPRKPTSPLVNVAISLFGKLLQSLLQLCIVRFLRGCTVCRRAVVSQLQQACDGLLVGLALRDLCQGWHCSRKQHGMRV